MYEVLAPYQIVCDSFSQGGAALFSIPYSMSTSTEPDPSHVHFFINPSRHFKVYVNGTESYNFSKFDDLMQRVVIAHNGLPAPKNDEYLKYSVRLEKDDSSIGPEMTVRLSVEPVADTLVFLHNQELPIRHVSRTPLTLIALHLAKQLRSHDTPQIMLSVVRLCYVRPLRRVTMFV